MKMGILKEEEKDPFHVNTPKGSFLEFQFDTFFFSFSLCLKDTLYNIQSFTTHTFLKRDLNEFIITKCCFKFILLKNNKMSKLCVASCTVSDLQSFSKQNVYYTFTRDQTLVQEDFKERCNENFETRQQVEIPTAREQKQLKMTVFLPSFCGQSTYFGYSQKAKQKVINGQWSKKMKSHPQSKNILKFQVNRVKKNRDENRHRSSEKLAKRQKKANKVFNTTGQQIRKTCHAIQQPKSGNGAKDFLNRNKSYEGLESCVSLLSWRHKNMFKKQKNNRISFGSMKMRRAAVITIFKLLLALTLCCASAGTDLPVFLENPKSTSAVDGSTTTFSCIAQNAEEIRFMTNKRTVIRRDLKVHVSSSYNNSQIVCEADKGSNNVKSEAATLTVQGPLSKVGDFSSSFINSSTINISWSPPFTLPGTAITGYNISVTSNGSAFSDFTSDSYYVLQLSDITDSPCNEINITVSGYNGLDGEANSISGIYLPSVPSPDANISVSVKINSFLQLMFEINVATLCTGERPSNLSVELINSSSLVGSADDVMLPQDTDTNILTVNTTLTVLEDQRYTAVVSFSNLAGEFNTTSEMNLSTFGVESVVITDTTGGRVCLECSFSSFSTDTGCTVELVSSGSSSSVQYTGTINRSGNGTAEGCVSGVTRGQYDISVYDQSSHMPFETFTGVNVTGETTTTTTTPTGRTTTPTTTSTRDTYDSTTTTVSPSTRPTSDNQNAVYIYISVPIGVAIIILIVVLVTLVACVVWQKNRKKRCGVMKDSSNAILAGSSSSTAPPYTTSQPQSLDYTYAKPNKEPTVVEPVVYADLSEIKKKSRPSPAKIVDCKVVYSNLLMKGQPPPPPYEPVELKQVSNLQASVTVIPAGVKVDDSEFGNEIVPHMDNYQEAVEQRVGSNYPPAPEGRAPSPPTEDENQPPPIPGCHLPDLIQNNHSLSKQEEGFTDESMHPALGELTSEKEEVQNGGHFMNTPTATYF